MYAAISYAIHGVFLWAIPASALAYNNSAVARCILVAMTHTMHRTDLLGELSTGGRSLLS